VLSERTTRIGRDPSAGIVIQDSSVSRFHAQITRQASGYYLADLESSNGAQVNGEPVTEPRRIVAGDQLCLGEVVLRCEEVAPEIAPTVQPEVTALTPDSATV
jgi:pSer/pThr/pTyr-binding forkhead associated (FHA) protein